MRVRDVPIAGQLTRLVWRKRRYCCSDCGRTFTETHEQLPTRQRVTGRFRARLAERVADGAAHAEVAREERTTRYQVACAFADCTRQRQARGVDRVPRRLSLDEAHHRRGGELATVVSDLDRRCVIEVLDGRDRRTVERWLSALPAEVRAGIEVVSIDPYDGYRQAIRAALPDARIVCDHFHLVRGANTALDAVRRERQRQAKARRPKGVRRSGQHAAWRPELYRARHRLLKARERLSERERRRLAELFEREPLIAEAWGLKERFRDIYRATNRLEAERRLDAFLATVDRAGLPAFDAFAKGIRIWPRRALGLLRRADHQRLRRGRHQQGQGHQAPRLRHPHLHRLPPARAPSMRLTGPPGATPLNRREPHFQPAPQGAFSSGLDNFEKSPTTARCSRQGPALLCGRKFEACLGDSGDGRPPVAPVLKSGDRAGGADAAQPVQVNPGHAQPAYAAEERWPTSSSPRSSCPSTTSPMPSRPSRTPMPARHGE
ncbi:MAG TPA: ISL3 family transposase, partial [Baekduia sp.]|nr:ISL3 family transposase [Baekduia sp.]